MSLLAKKDDFSLHSIDESELKMALSRLQHLKKEISKVVIGQNEVLDQLLISFLANGHALMESYPGMGKTLMVKTMAAVTSLRFSRVQSTPDLLPADIIGTYIIQDTDGRKTFTFKKGPIFANILLADEINRATPKTQSAFLEAMQEKQVTVGNETMKLEEPFFVLATQNPIDMEGSLSPEQKVFINGGIKTGEELIEVAKKMPFIESKSCRIYGLGDSYTYSLDSKGRIEKRKCGLYVLPYEGEVVSIRTRTGRLIKVTKNHPFLVSENGHVKWKRAEELTLGDFLISPAKLPPGDEREELMTHGETIEELKSRYNVITHEDLLELRHISKGFSDFSSLDGAGFDKLRISLSLGVKQLAANLLLDKKGYWKLVRYLRGNRRNEELKRLLAGFFLESKPMLSEETDFIESYRITKIRRFRADPDIAFFIAFLLSDGTVSDDYVAAYQKNYSASLDRFISIAKRIGLAVGICEKKGGRTAKILSKPFADYMKLRFGIGRPSWLLSFPEKLRKEFLRTFIAMESHLDLKRRRILFSQASEEKANLISYMLLKEGIISWARFEKKGKGIFRIKIQGSDFARYLENIGWLEKTFDFHKEGIVGSISTHRTVPVSKKMLTDVVKLLGLDSFRFPGRKEFAQRGWYNAYRNVKGGREYMSEALFRQMISDLKGEIEYRKSIDINSLVRKEPRKAAALCGLPMTEIAKNTVFKKHEVWNLYSGQQHESHEAISEHIEMVFSQRLVSAEKLISYFEGLSTDFIFYDRIRSMRFENYEGPVFGLMVPGTHNYVAGFGGCGINHNTYPLPEAQVDRFLVKILLDYPSRDEEKIIAEMYSAVEGIAALNRVMDRNDVMKLQKLTRMVPISTEVRDYALDIVQKTRKHEHIEFGASPRASIGLIVAAKAYALLNQRTFVSKKDIQYVALPVLRHRIILNFQAEKEGLKADDVVKKLL
ncbi:MAG: AAA family ATPase [Candidatus Aenigmarchaeota archaeon]|nr:AAA family ATPase [Candidatus Aenigmarchaeota archaeon]